MENKSFSIREASEGDIETIFNFICELADYEKLRSDVTATVPVLRESLFVKKQAEVIIAEEQGIPVGFALYFHNFSTFKGRACLYLEDIYVNPEHRGKGYGKRLFAALAKIAVERECERFDWSVLDWNKPSIEFYKSLGAIPMDEWTVYRLSGDALRKVAGN
ncbi:MAG: GNAT family N-acetyltransferase [Bacteroidetes bacterium HGW-Bacteroidetes-10]|nr:MAG: GNAT family N-acetyltransferase [Bacteroidetes bacterium HGW-Bacteroidetes-10]